MSMGTQRRIRHKIFEWLRRYAPNEIAGWVGQLGAAAATYALTGSYAAAVIAATIGASAGYYAAAYFNGVRWSYRAQAGRSWPMRVLVANGLAARSIAVEFGPAEAIDSITIRPIALYLGPLVVGNTAVGFVLGSIVADILLLRDGHLQLRALHETASATSTRKCPCMTLASAQEFVVHGGEFADTPGAKLRANNGGYRSHDDWAGVSAPPHIWKRVLDHIAHYSPRAAIFRQLRQDVITITATAASCAAAGEPDPMRLVTHRHCEMPAS